MGSRDSLKRVKRVVVKIGSALLTDDGRGLDTPAIDGWVEQMATAKLRGIELVLVSSGSVAAGMTRLGWVKRPRGIHELQAAAAIGQMGLVQTYESAFSKFDLHTAQILLDHDDLSSRQRYLNARSTLRTLTAMDVVPVVNENDTVVTDEIRFGDNDTLAALVANLIEADLLILLTDQDGMYDADPRTNPNAKLLLEMPVADERLDVMAGDGGALGRGGMTTKVRAARVAARSGANTVIVGGRLEGAITRVLAAEPIGTLMRASEKPQAARKRWLSGHMQTRGSLQLDDGAVKALQHKGVSLLPVGIYGVCGEFTRGEVVACVDSKGVEVARGLINYSSSEAQLIAGKSSRKIESLLGYKGDDELIHRDNLVLV